DVVMPVSQRDRLADNGPLTALPYNNAACFGSSSRYGARHSASSLATEFARGETLVATSAAVGAGHRSRRSFSAWDCALDDGTKSHSSAAAGSRMTGMRSWMGATASLASVVRIVKVRCHSDVRGSSHFSYSP